MSISTPHPLYSKCLKDWRQMRVTYEGEREVKNAGFEYLPATDGMIKDGALTLNASSGGWLAYCAYKTRSVFPDLVRQAVAGLLGVMHNKDATIELPSQMEHLIESATLEGESLQMLLQKMTELQLVAGRLGLLLDVQDVGASKGDFYVSLYEAETIINWDDGQREEIERSNLNLVVLDESSAERGGEEAGADPFTWRDVEKYRVLVLGDPLENEPEGEGIYRQAVFEKDQSFDPSKLEEPRTGRGTSNEVPFVFVNSKDALATPDRPPLLGLSNISLTIYRGEADYRQSLFMTGQDTLVVIGDVDDKPNRRVGAHAEIALPIGGDARYIGVNSAGIPEQRQSLENDRTEARSMTSDPMESTSRDAESGEALKIRVSARTATLNHVAKASAHALEKLLRIGARWMGADPEAVAVEPNLDFVDDTMSGQELTQLQGAKTMGAPLSSRTIHGNMQKKGVTEMTFEEEIAQLAEERENEDLNPPPPSMDPEGPEEDEDEEEEEVEAEKEPVGASR